MEEIFVLVYVDYESLLILELGNKEFISKKYIEYKSKTEEFLNKWKEFDRSENNLPDEYYEDPFYKYWELDRFCIQGYSEDRSDIICVCRKFGFELDEPIYY
jgi:hypothetical protein